MKGLTKTQQSTLDFISIMVKKNGYPPTRREMAIHFDVSIGAIQNRLTAIENKGFIRIGIGARAITILQKDQEWEAEKRATELEQERGK